MKKPWQFMGAQNIGDEDDPYLDRLRILASPFFSVYLHHIHRDDNGNPPHDHPWPFASLVLTGGYTEAYYPEKADVHRMRKRTFLPWSFHWFSTKAAHQIIAVDRPLWTLVFTGPVRNPQWGFYINGKHILWSDYDGIEPITAGWPVWKHQGVVR